MIYLLIVIALYFIFKKLGPSRTLQVILITFCIYPDNLISFSYEGDHLVSLRNVFSNTYTLVTFLSIYGFIWFKELPFKLRKFYYLIIFLLLFPQLFGFVFLIIERFTGVSILAREVGMIGNLIGIFIKYIAPFGLFPIGYLIFNDEKERNIFLNKTLPLIAKLGVFISIYGIFQIFSPYRFFELADDYIYQQFRLTTISSRDPNGTIRVLFFPLMASFFLYFLTTKRFYYIHFLVILTAVILTFSRSGWISVGLTVLIILFIYSKNIKLRIISSLTVLIIYILFTISIDYRDEIFGYDEFESKRVKSLSTFEDRYVLWAYSLSNLDFISLIFGRGSGSAQFYTGLSLEGKFELTSVHNLYLFYLYEAGIFSLISFILLITISLKIFFSSSNKFIDKQNNLRSLLFMGLALIIFPSLHGISEPTTAFYVSLGAGFIFTYHIYLNKIKYFEQPIN